MDFKTHAKPTNPDKVFNRQDLHPRREAEFGLPLWTWCKLTLIVLQLSVQISVLKRVIMSVSV